MNYVLKLCGWYPSRVDPLSGDFVQRQAIAIAGQCKTVVLFAQKDPGLKGWKIEPVFSQQGNLYEYIFYYPKKRWLDKLWSQWFYLRILKQFIPGLVHEHGAPSLLHINVVWRAAIWALYLQSGYKWPMVITEHSTEYLPEAKDNIRNKSASRQMITRRAFSSCHLFFPVSNHLAGVIQELYGLINYQVIPNVVDTSLFCYKPKKVRNEYTRFLHISTMGYQKNMEGIINVLSRLAVNSPSFEAYFVGPENEQVKEMVKADKNLEGKIIFTGSVSYPEVAALMQTADCLLQFSRYENLPCVILEALCSGLPVISSDVGGIPEIITPENGVLVPALNETAFLEAITRMIEGKIVFNNEMIAEKARALYNYEKVGQTYLQAYHSLLALATGNPLQSII